MQSVLAAPDEDKAPKDMSILEAEFYDAGAVLLLSERYRKRLRTTSLGAPLMGKDEKWTNT